MQAGTRCVQGRRAALGIAIGPRAATANATDATIVAKKSHQAALNEVLLVFPNRVWNADAVTSRGSLNAPSYLRCRTHQISTRDFAVV